MNAKFIMPLLAVFATKRLHSKCCDRNNHIGGGVAVFYKHDLNPVRVCLPENLSTVEAVCIHLKITTCIRMLCVYR